jgi:hypothetical protein
MHDQPPRSKDAQINDPSDGEFFDHQTIEARLREMLLSDGNEDIHAVLTEILRTKEPDELAENLADLAENLTEPTAAGPSVTALAMVGRLGSAIGTGWMWHIIQHDRARSQDELDRYDGPHPTEVILSLFPYWIAHDLQQIAQECQSALGGSRKAPGQPAPAISPYVRLYMACEAAARWTLQLASRQFVQRIIHQSSRGPAMEIPRPATLPRPVQVTHQLFWIYVRSVVRQKSPDKIYSAYRKIGEARKKKDTEEKKKKKEENFNDFRPAVQRDIYRLRRQHETQPTPATIALFDGAENLFSWRFSK